MNGGVKTGCAYKTSDVREIKQDILGISTTTPIFLESGNLMRLFIFYIMELVKYVQKQT